MNRAGMRKSWGLALVLSALLVGGAVIAQDKDNEAAEGMPEMGPPKEMGRVEHMVGKWDVDQKFRMDPSQEWQESKATVECRLAVGGAALISDFRGEMMGMPFVGMQVECYSREEKAWQSIWIDNLGAQISLATGNMEGDKLVMTGTEKWNGQESLYRATTYNMKDDSYDWKYENSTDGGKTWSLTMESHYTKQK